MIKYFGWCLLLLAIGFVETAQCQSDSDEEKQLQDFTKDQLSAVVQKIIHLDSTKQYFSGIDPSTVTPELKMAKSGGGWAYVWHYEKEVKWIPSPPGFQVGTVPEIDSEDGLLFSTYISYDHGDAFIECNDRFQISASPRMFIGFYFMNKEGSDAWKKGKDYLSGNPVARDIADIMLAAVSPISAKLSSSLTAK